MTSICYTAETNTLCANYTPIKFFKKKAEEMHELETKQILEKITNNKTGVYMKRLISQKDIKMLMCMNLKSIKIQEVGSPTELKVKICVITDEI